MERNDKEWNAFRGGVLFFIVSTLLGIVLTWAILKFDNVRGEIEEGSTSSNTSEVATEESTVPKETKDTGKEVKTTESISTEEKTTEERTTEKTTRNTSDWIRVDKEETTEKKDSKNEDLIKGKTEEKTEKKTEAKSTTQIESLTEIQTETATEEKTDDKKTAIVDEAEKEQIYGLDADHVATTRRQLADALYYATREDESTDVALYSEGLTENDFREINYYADKTYVEAFQYTYYTDNPRKGITKTVFSLRKKETYYVYNSIVRGVSIPAGEEEAVEEEKIVREILGSTINTSMSEFEKELALHDYLIYHCRYGTENRDDPQYHSAYGALVNHVAVCEGYAYALELLLNCSGINCRYIHGTTVGSDSGHAWNLVEIGGDWYHIDSTWDDPVTDSNLEIGQERHTYFNIPDDYIHGLRHEWDVEEYTKCTSMEYNYFHKKGLLYDTYDGFVAYVNDTIDRGSVSSIELAVLDYSDKKYDIRKVISDSRYNGAYSWHLGGGDNVTGYQSIKIEFK